MPLKKPVKDLKIAVLVPTYKRPEYTKKCLKALSEDGCEYDLITHPGDKGLRDAVLDFFDQVRGKYDIIAKMDNDCVVPNGWLDKIVRIFESSHVDILSPNVFPSDAAHTHGRKDEGGYGFLPTDTIGGLWVMKAEMIEDIQFERLEIGGITGAIPLLRQIILEKDPIMGWVEDVIVQDIGHWSGDHPENIKTKEHEQYYHEVGRRIAWEGSKNACQEDKEIQEVG